MKKIIVIMTVSIVLLSTGCSKSKSFDVNADDETQPASSVTLDASQTDLLNGKIPVRLYYGKKDTGKLDREIRYISKDDALKTVNNLAKRIVSEVISGPDANSGVTAIIPSDIQQVGDPNLEMTSGTMKVNLSSKFLSSFDSAEMETLAIVSIVDSLTEIKEVDSVQILIDGKENEKMKNGTKLDKSYKRDTSMIENVQGNAEDADNGQQTVIFDDIGLE